MAELFVSDLHLDAQSAAANERFLAFLTQEAAQARVLYILGDLFEARCDPKNTPAARNSTLTRLDTRIREASAFVSRGRVSRTACTSARVPSAISISVTAAVSAAGTITLRTNFDIISARTTCRWGRCRRQGAWHPRNS